MDKKLQEILDEMFLSHNELTFEKVRQIQLENPTLARQIGEAFAEWQVFELKNSDNDLVDASELSPSAEMALKNALAEVSSRSILPITDLGAAFSERGIDRANLISELQISETILRKLIRRQIEVPRFIADKIAGILSTTSDAIDKYFSMPPTLSQNASYKSSMTPRTGAKQSFAAAVNGDPELTEAEKSNLLKMLG